MSGSTLASFRRAEAADKDELLAFLRLDLGNCLYLYLDIDKYGIGSSVIDVMVQRREDRSLLAIVMRYADSYQIYAPEDSVAEVEYSDLIKLINETKVNRVSAPRSIIQKLLVGLKDLYTDSYGVVMELKKYKPMTISDIVIEEAEREDIPEIVKLINSDDDLGQSYEYCDMLRQFEDRYDQGMGKSFVIRKNGDIVAHLGFSAITTEFVIAAYTVVKPSYRDFPYGVFLDSYLINSILPSLEKRGFAFMQEPRRIKLFELMGNPIVGEYGKLLRKEEE